MSDRQLREYLDSELWRLVNESGECTYCGGCGYHSDRCEIGMALAEPPDVVSLAKRQKNYLSLAGGDPGDKVNPYDPLSEKGRIWWRGYRQAVADDLNDLQSEFGFHLTPDGYEWTEEATDEG